MMAQNFASRFAPNLALPSMDSSGSGITGPEADHPYDSTGTPLPYMQNAGNARQYFGTPGPDGLRGTMPDAGPTNVSPPIGGLRGLTPPMGGQHDIPVTGDGLRGRMPFAAGIDRHEGDDLRGLTAVTDIPHNILNGPQHGPSVTLAIPPYDPRVLEDRIMTGIRTGHINPITPDRVLQGMAQQGDTLESLLAHFNFQLPSLGQQSRSVPRQMSKPRDYISNANSIGDYPDFSSNDGLAEFNRRMGINIGPQVRSQAEQDRLVNGGYTVNRVSWHTSGRAADIRPRDIGGLTGQAAVNEVQRRLTAAGYQQMQAIWESGHESHQGTGAHVHIEPIGRPQ